MDSTSFEAMESKVVGYHASHITPLYGNGYAKHYANISMEQLVLDRPLSFLTNPLNLIGGIGSLAVRACFLLLRVYVYHPLASQLHVFI